MYGTMTLMKASILCILELTEVFALLTCHLGLLQPQLIIISEVVTEIFMDALVMVVINALAI
jgi:hypothetical protein